jgi:hypothetical protein
LVLATGSDLHDADGYKPNEINISIMDSLKATRLEDGFCCNSLINKQEGLKGNTGFSYIPSGGFRNSNNAKAHANDNDK